MDRKLNFNEIFSQRPDLEALKGLPRFPVTLVVENIRSMHNVGSFFRSSDGVCLEKIYLTGYTPQPPRAEIFKTALGATESVPWEYSNNPSAVVEGLKQKGHTIVALEQTTKSIPYYKAHFTFPLCLILGNEVNGVSDDLIRLADMAVDIPMYGIKHSLNVSVAYGVIIYHLLSIMPQGLR